MEKEQIIHTMGMGNCGGRCLLHLHVQDGQIRRISTEPACADSTQQAADSLRTWDSLSSDLFP